MPCRCDYMEDYKPKKPSNPNNGMVDNKKYKGLKKSYEELIDNYNGLKAECDKVTQLLCYMCGTHVDRIPYLDHRLGEWWKKHCEWDFNRTLETFKQHFDVRDQKVSKDAAYKWFVEEAVKVHPLSEYHKNVFFTMVWGEFDEWQEDRVNRMAKLEALKSKKAELEKLIAELEVK